jgi:hypothetical protein
MNLRPAPKPDYARASLCIMGAVYFAFGTRLG